MLLGGTPVSEDNKELNQLHSAERDSNVTEMKLTLPRGFSVDSRQNAANECCFEWQRSSGEKCN